MSKPKPKWQRLLSFNRYRKRFGASKVADDLDHPDYEQLKSTIIAGEEPVYTFGSKKDVQEHITDLRNEFIGQSELAYYHAKLIVLIRREYQVAQQMALFNALWQKEADFLCQHLSIRWLISAADTFIDHGGDDLQSAVLMNAIVLINTIKLDETERYLHHSNDNTMDDERKTAMKDNRLALFDGVSGFAIGTDDTLRNMRWRLDKICASHPRGDIVRTIFVRMHQYDNVYSRFKNWHHRERTAWWHS